MHPLMGKKVVIMCSNYIYAGTLEATEVDVIVLGSPSIIYETGEWGAPKWKDAQKLPTKRSYIERGSVESMFEVERTRATKGEPT